METDNSKFEAAVKKAYAIRDLRIQYASWVGGSIVIWACTPYLVSWVEGLGVGNEKFLIWLRLNILCIPFFALLILLGKTAWIYRQEIGRFFRALKPGFLKRWEAKKIEEIMHSEE